MSFLATKRKIGLFCFRLCKKKKEEEKVVKSCARWCLQRFAMASTGIFFFSVSCCCAHFCDFFLRHQRGFKITCEIAAVKIPSLCLNWPLGFSGWAASDLGEVAFKAASKSLAWILLPGAGAWSGGSSLPRQRNARLEDFLGVDTSRRWWVQPRYHVAYSSWEGFENLTWKTSQP